MCARRPFSDKRPDCGVYHRNHEVEPDEAWNLSLHASEYEGGGADVTIYLAASTLSSLSFPSHTAQVPGYCAWTSALEVTKVRTADEAHELDIHGARNVGLLPLSNRPDINDSRAPLLRGHHLLRRHEPHLRRVLSCVKGCQEHTTIISCCSCHYTKVIWLICACNAEALAQEDAKDLNKACACFLHKVFVRVELPAQELTLSCLNIGWKQGFYTPNSRKKKSWCTLCTTHQAADNKGHSKCGLRLAPSILANLRLQKAHVPCASSGWWT